MKALSRPRTWIALLLGIAAGLLTHCWRGSPRLVMHFDYTCWHLAFSPDGTRLAMLDRKPGVKVKAQVLVWDAATGALLNHIDLGTKYYSEKVVFAPDGESLAVVETCTVTKIDLEANRVSAQYDHQAWSPPPKDGNGGELLFSTHGRWLLHRIHKGRVYDVETDRVVLDYAERWPNRHLSAYGGHVAVLIGGEVKTFDVMTGKEIGRFAPHLNQPFARNALSFSADGTHGVYWVASGEFVIHNGITGTQCALPMDWDMMAAEDCWSTDNRYYVGTFCTAPHGPVDWLLRWLRGTNWSTAVFDTSAGLEVVPRFTNCEKCCFSPDIKTLAVAQRGGRLALWDWPPPSRWPHAGIAGIVAAFISLLIAWKFAKEPRTK
jgi:WD40 repeat protein